MSKTADDFYRYEDLAGDCFNPEVNSDIDKAELARQERKFKARIRNAGAWSFSTEYWTGREWEDDEGMSHNSIGGFVGNDFLGSGYEVQLLQEALEAYEAQPLDADGFVVDPFRRQQAA